MKENNKKRRKSSRDKNIENVAKKKERQDRVMRRDNALKEGLQLLKYREEVNKKVAQNKNYIIEMTKKDPNFKKPMGVRSIICSMNKKYGVKNDESPLSRTTLMRYKTFGLAGRQRVGAPEYIPTILLNAMRLHIKIVQLSKQGQASSQVIKSKLMAAAKGTKYEGFDSDWAWRRLREMYPEEIAPSTVSRQDTIRNEWTTYTKVNDWFTFNKKTLIESGLAIDRKKKLPDGSEAELSIGEIEKRRIINFDETDHPFSTVADRGGSRSIPWGDPALAKGISFILPLYYIMHTSNIYYAIHYT